MVKPVFDVLEIHREVILRDFAMVVEHVFSITPKAFEPIHVVTSAFIGHCSMMTDRVMFAVALKRLIASEGVGLIDRALASARADVAHELLRGDGFDYLGIGPSVVLEEAKDDAFSGCLTPLPAFASDSEVSLVELDLALQSPRLQPSQVKQCLSEALIDTADDFDIAPPSRRPAGRLAAVGRSPWGSRSLDAFDSSSWSCSSCGISCSRARCG